MKQFTPDQLASPEYKAQLLELRAKATQKWGADGALHTEMVKQYIDETGAQTVLDYGCGEGMLGQSLNGLITHEYDPGIPGKQDLPPPVDLVVSTDVIEHIEPALIDSVLEHMYQTAKMAGLFIISTRLAVAILPDGRNAHLIVEKPEWWEKKLTALGWKVERKKIKPHDDVTFWLRK